MYRASDVQRPDARGELAICPILSSIHILILQSVTTPPTRKRQKKADSRVAELERKIDALTATLHAQKTGAPEIRHHGGIPQHEGNNGAVSIAEGSFRMGTLSHDWGNSAPNRYSDVPPGYGPAQTFQQGPDAKRRKLDSNSHAVGFLDLNLARLTILDDTRGYGCHPS
tara:strand:+ start:6697 stop:7203 length:507 start_codon:yes stop_codon:yes gene_type:complete